MPETGEAAAVQSPLYKEILYTEEEVDARIATMSIAIVASTSTPTRSS